METKIGQLKKNIAESFSRIGSYLTFTNSVGYTDFNSDAERFFIEILNVAYGYTLQELNIERANYPAIDLADNRRRVCIQVTTTGDNTKFNKTLEVYKKNNFDKKYDQLIFLILSDSHRITATDLNVTTKVISLRDLYKSVAALKDDDIQYIATYIQDYLQERKAASDNAPNHGIHYTIGAAKKFIKWSNVEEEDILSKDLKNFAETLSKLTNDQRSYLNFLVLKGHTPTNGHYYEKEDHIIVPVDLERAHYGSQGYHLFNSLKADDLVIIDDEYDQHGDSRYVAALEPVFRGEVPDFNLFAKIKQFLNGDATMLRRVFINCDFSKLN